MLLRRLFACSTSILWPTTVAVVSAVIAFHPLRVEAESAAFDAGPTACSSPSVVACADSGAGQACTFDDLRGVLGACRRDRCGDAWSTAKEALVCTRVRTCEDLAPYAHGHEGCGEGRSVGDGCVDDERRIGSCAPLACERLDDAGAFEQSSLLYCRVETTREPNAGGSTDGGAGASREAGDAPSEGGDSGCSVGASGASRTSCASCAGAAFAVPIGVALLFARRRRRTR